MKKFSVAVERCYTYEVIVEASNEDEAREIVRNFAIDELEPFQNGAWFEYEYGVEID